MKQLKSLFTLVFTCTTLLCVAQTDHTKDIEGNLYPTVKIGNQIWMTEDLRVTHYNDGTSLNDVKIDSIWVKSYKEKIPMYCKIGGEIYYNAYVLLKNNVCPSGFRVPTTEDWQILIEATNKKKGIDKVGMLNGWGFNVTYPGVRSGRSGVVSDVGDTGIWWSQTPMDSYQSGVSMNSRSFAISPGAYEQEWGFSIRCMKDK